MGKLVSDIKKEGLSDFLRFSLAEQVKYAIDVGFRHFEITSDIFQLMPFKIKESEQNKLISFKEEYNISYSIHLPIWGVDLSSPNRFVREASVQSIIDTYQTFDFLEGSIEVFVLHPTGSFAYDTINMVADPKVKRFTVDFFSNFAVQSIEKIISQININLNKIAIENILFPFKKTVEITEKFEGVKLCIDTAHILGGFSNNFDGQLNLIEIGKKYIDKAREIHLQDFNPGEGIDHGALGTYKFPAKFINILYENDFKGPVVFELSYKEAYESILFIREHYPGLELPELKLDLISN